MLQSNTMPFGFSSFDSRMSTLIANAWLSTYRYHASERDQSGVFELSPIASRIDIEAARKIAYEVSSSIHLTLSNILCFADCYKKHEGLSRPSANYIMRDDQTVFLHGLLLLGLDTDIAPQFAIQLHKQSMQLVTPMELLLGVNLNAVKRVGDIAKVGGYKSLPIEAQQNVLDFAAKQIKQIRSYLRSTGESLGVDIDVIEQISEQYKHDLGYIAKIEGLSNSSQSTSPA